MTRRTRQAGRHDLICGLLSPLHAVAIFAAGIAAGTINTIVGSGTLITFPTLLAFGYPPVTANVSNTIGLVPGSVSGAIGYRRELRGQGRRAMMLAIGSTLGGVTGAVLLLELPAAAFKTIVPVFIAVALVLILTQRQLQRLIGEHRRAAHQGTPPIAVIGSFFSGIYGGYFGAAQGIMLMALFGLTIDDDIQRLNALKVVIAGLVNLVAGIVFVFAADVNWGVAGSDRRRVDPRRSAGRPLRQAAVAQRAQGRDRDRRGLGDHPAAVGAGLKTGRCGRGGRGPSRAPHESAANTGGIRKGSGGEPAMCPRPHPDVPDF